MKKNNDNYMEQNEKHDMTERIRIIIHPSSSQLESEVDELIRKLSERKSLPEPAALIIDLNQ